MEKSSESPILCAAGCGFYGNEAFNDMCSKCYKEKTKSETEQETQQEVIPETIESNKRKHVRTPTPEPKEPDAAPSDDQKKDTSEQINKGKCFNCRKKVPLAKQAANKCRCGFIFCDTHRYPDRHDCEIDFAKLDREILAKNNPKFHERPKGGRSFQRIDSL